jgi:hypothetical protein
MCFMMNVEFSEKTKTELDLFIVLLFKNRMQSINGYRCPYAPCQKGLRREWWVIGSKEPNTL